MIVYHNVVRAKVNLKPTFDAAPQLIFVFDKNSHVLSLNKTAKNWLSNHRPSDHNTLNQAAWLNVNDVEGKHVHELMHPVCSNAKCYLKQLLSLSHQVISTGEPAEYSGFDAELNLKLSVQMIPFTAGVTIANIKTDGNNYNTANLSQLIMTFFDVSQLENFQSSFQPSFQPSFHPSLKNLNRWQTINHTLKNIKTAKISATLLPLHDRQTVGAKLADTRLKDNQPKEISLKKIKREGRLKIINQQIQADIEQCKLIELAQTISEQKLSHLDELMQEGLVIQDLNKKITHANKHLLKMLDLPRNDVVGHYFGDFVDDDYLETWAGKLKNLKSAESDYVFKMYGFENKVIWVKGALRLLFDAAKNCKGSYMVITNINDQFETKQKLLRTENKLRSLAKQVLFAQEQERKRIALELHDGIGQTLSAIKFFVENCIINANNAEPANAIAEFEKVVPKLQGAVEEVRRISMALRPSLLDDIGILATLQWFCRESNASTPQINFLFNNKNVVEADISPNLKTEIFRIVQEAVNNASKYSHANHIKITTKDDGKLLRLEVVDDGVGFDYAAIASNQGYAESKGLGLVSMRERVVNSNGQFTVNSGPLKGTTITCIWPKGESSFTDNRSGRTDRRKIY